MNMSRSVCEAVVARGLCIGCGVCAATCPESALAIEFNRLGELVARESGSGACRNCGKCLLVCPFSPQAENEDVLARLAFRGEPGLRWSAETGFYGACLAGHVNPEERRMSRSSGGLASWFLSKLLNRGFVDRIVCVGTGRENPLAYGLMTGAEEVLASARSGYYPVTLSSALREVKEGSDRVAIVGLPCFVKAVRLAMRHDAELSGRVQVLAGLVCGGTRSRFYAQCLCALGGGMPQTLERVDFRVKEGKAGAGEFGFRFTCRSDSGPTEGTVESSERGRFWSRRYFEPQACRFCDDVFAETADVVFMDAWLDRYARDPRGTNLVLARKSWVRDLFTQGAELGEVALEDVPVADLTASQQGVVRRKRVLLAERLTALADSSVVAKRVRPVPVGGLRRVQVRMEERLIHRSREAFADALENAKSPSAIVRRFGRAMHGREMIARLVNRLARLLPQARESEPARPQAVTVADTNSAVGIAQ